MNYGTYSLPNCFFGACCVVPALVAFALGQGGAASSDLPPLEPLRPVARLMDLPAMPDATVGGEKNVAIADVAKQGPTALLQRATVELARRRSIAAKVRHRADLYGRELIGSGEYAQGPSSSRLLRYELRMQVNERVVSLLQVGDGQHLWISRQLTDEPSIERIEIDKVLAAAGQGGAAVGGGLLHSIGIGGLPQMLAAMERDFEFDEVFQAQLGQLSVYGVGGGWKRAALAELLPAQEAQIAAGGSADLRQLRPHVPDRVVVYFGADDLFPYRIEYHRTAVTRPGAEGKSNDAKPADGERPLLVLEFYEVRFDVLLEERLFQFTAGSRPYADVTDAFIQARGR